MKIGPYQTYTKKWILVPEGECGRVACSEESYASREEAIADISRVLADLEVESQKAIKEISKELDSMEDENIYPDRLPFFERLQVSWDLKSTIKSIWLTGYILITWEWDYNFWKTLDIAFYSGGSYG